MLRSPPIDSSRDCVNDGTSTQREQAMRSPAVLWMALLLSTGACKGKESVATKSEPPGAGGAEVKSAKAAAPATTSMRLVSVPLQMKANNAWTTGAAKGLCTRTVFYLDPEMNVTLGFEGPAGAAVEIAGQKATLTGGKAEVKVNLLQPLFAALKGFTHRGKWYDPIQFDLSLPVAYPDTTGTAKTQLALGGSNVLAWFLDQTVVKGKPARGPDEAATGEKGKAFLKFYPDKRHLHFTPPDGKLEDVRLVVISEYLGSKDKSCGSYRGVKTGQIKELKVTFVSRRLTLVDRRSGAVVGKQTFTGHGSCPRRVKDTVKVYYPDDKAMDKFVAVHMK
jgi:hypothetical protein